MPHDGLSEADLADLYELNLSFVALLSRRARAHVSCLGLDRWSSRLALLSPVHRERLAQLPRALFVPNLALAGTADRVSCLPNDDVEAERRAFAAGALIAIWQLARRRPAMARLLYQLSEDAVGALARVGIDELVEQAARPDVVRAAVLDEALWEAAISADESEPSRMMVLIMLARPEPLPDALGVSLYGVA